MGERDSSGVFVATPACKAVRVMGGLRVHGGKQGGVSQVHAAGARLVFISSSEQVVSKATTF
jgi:hypothetical protein